MRFKKITKKRDGTVSITYEQVPSIKNWVHNIKTVKDLWEHLNKNYEITSLVMRNLNQDPVENFFSSVRSHGGANTNPTCQQFENTYKTLVVNNLNSNHSLGANCEKDPNEMLQNLDSLLMKKNEPPMNDEPMESLADGEISEHRFECTDGEISNTDLESSTGTYSSIMQDETKKYVAGFVLKKLKTNIYKSCNKCNYELCDTTPPQDHDYIHIIDITRKSLFRTSQNFLNCVKDIIKIIKSFLKNNPGQSNIMKKIKLLVDQRITFDFLTCNSHKINLKIYICNFVIKMIIHSWCNNVNRILKGKLSNTHNDNIKIQALNYYRTHKHKGK